MGCSSVALSLLLAVLGPAATALEPGDGQRATAGELALDSSCDMDCYQGGCRRLSGMRQHASLMGERAWMASYRHSLWAGWDTAPSAEHNGAEIAYDETVASIERADGEISYSNDDAYGNDVTEKDDVAYDEYQDVWESEEDQYDVAENKRSDDDVATDAGQPLVWIRDASGYWTIAEDSEVADADSYESVDVAENDAYDAYPYEAQYGAAAEEAVLDTVVLWMSGSLERVGDAFHGLARRVSGLRGGAVSVGSRTGQALN